MKRHFGMILLMAGTLGAAGGVTAAELNSPESEEIRSVGVPYEASEVRDERAAEALFFRIRQAAEDVCRIASNPRGYEIWYEHTCQADAVAEAVQDVDEPALNEYYSERRGSAMPR